MGITADLSAVKAAGKKPRQKRKQTSQNERKRDLSLQSRSLATRGGLRIVDEGEDTLDVPLDLDKTSADRRPVIWPPTRDQYDDTSEFDDEGNELGPTYDEAAQIILAEHSERNKRRSPPSQELDLDTTSRRDGPVRKQQRDPSGSEAEEDRGEESRKKLKVNDESPSTETAEGAGEVIYRDMDGFRITKARWLEIQATKKRGYKVRREEKEKKPERQPVVWGKGIHQEEEMKRKQEEELRIASQPLARHEIDSTLDLELREVQRWDDPLKNLSTTSSRDLPASSSNQGGPSQSSSQPSRPKSRFTAPPNRFGVQPGYRWDGVVRGNGYESRFLQEKNKKVHQEQEAYKWSIEEM